jgi:Protein of unknown function (DUF2510)
MSTDGTSQPANPASFVPAGWYPDPAGGDGKRWWDGATWSAHVQEAPAPPPVATFGAYVPPEARALAPLPTAGEAGIAYTRTSWWLAWSPIWVVVPQATVVGVFYSIAPPPLAPLVLGLAVVNIVVWAVLLRMAYVDRTALHSGGNNSAASPLWVFLTPLAYLIVRARHVALYATGGWASVIWWCVAAFFTPALSIAGVFAAFGIFAA